MKKNNRRAKRLAIEAETLRELSGQNLQHVAGGREPSECQTNSCVVKAAIEPSECQRNSCFVKDPV